MSQPAICALCGGAFELKTITYQQHWGDDLYEFENVPAYVCSQCGEIWLTAEVAQRIEAILERQPEPKRYHDVPVFSLT